MKGGYIDRCVVTFLATHNIRNCFGYIVVVVFFIHTTTFTAGKNFHIFFLTTLRLSSYHIFFKRTFLHFKLDSCNKI